MIKYRVSWDKIEPVCITKETPKSVTYYDEFWRGDRREMKNSTDVQWFDTWDQAHSYLVDHAEAKVKSARMLLERAKGTLGNIKGMKRPE